MKCRRARAARDPRAASPAPSSHQPSEAYDGFPTQVSSHMLVASRTPQSLQSVPNSQTEYSAPRPPSSHEPSEADAGFPTQVSSQRLVGG